MNAKRCSLFICFFSNDTRVRLLAFILGPSVDGFRQAALPTTHLQPPPPTFRSTQPVLTVPKPGHLAGGLCRHDHTC